MNSTSSWIDRNIEELRALRGGLPVGKVAGYLGYSPWWVRSHAQFFPRTVRIPQTSGHGDSRRMYDPRDVIAYLEYLAAHQRRPQTAREIANTVRSE